MFISLSKVRFTGGRFLRGHLAGVTVVGLPAYFESQGRIKQKYNWMKPDDIFNPFKSAAQPHHTPRRPCRICAIRLPPPHRNTKWQPDAAGSFTTIETNLYTQSKFPFWDKPVGWNTAWPQDPTSITQNERQCSLCNKLVCRCIHEKVLQAGPDIVDAGPMGQGVVATVEYNVGDLIGELIGEITPLNKAGNGWGITLSRDDLGDEEFHDVCVIQCEHFGNWARMVNHSCEPNVLFIEMPISGRWRIMLEATKPIKVGEVIVTSYGKEYFAWSDKGEKIKCLCGTKSCFENQKS